MSCCDSHWKTPAISAANLSSLERANPWPCRERACTPGCTWPPCRRGLEVLGGNPSQTRLCHSAQHTPELQGPGAPLKEWVYKEEVSACLQKTVSPQNNALWGGYCCAEKYVESLPQACGSSSGHHNLGGPSGPPLRARLGLPVVQVVSGDLSPCPWRITCCGKALWTYQQD